MHFEDPHGINGGPDRHVHAVERLNQHGECRDHFSSLTAAALLRTLPSLISRDLILFLVLLDAFIILFLLFFIHAPLGSTL
jgi:hypothetical protein